MCRAENNKIIGIHVNTLLDKYEGCVFLGWELNNLVDKFVFVNQNSPK